MPNRLPHWPNRLAEMSGHLGACTDGKPLRMENLYGLTSTDVDGNLPLTRATGLLVHSELRVLPLRVGANTGPGGFPFYHPLRVPLKGYSQRLTGHLSG